MKGDPVMVLNFRRIETDPPDCAEKQFSATTGGSFHESKTPTDDQSVLKILNQVMLQVEYNNFADRRLNRIDPLYKELCLIIAEVLVLDQDFIKINGTYICAHLVKEEYSQLRNDHLRLVFNNYLNVTKRVFNKRSYLRTALYNAVFEIESHYANDVRVTY